MKEINNIINLKEYDSIGPEKCEFLSDPKLIRKEDRRLINEITKDRRRIELRRDLDGSFRIKSYEWVGTIKFSNFTINIYPKFDEIYRDLTTLIEFAYGINIRLYDQKTKFLKGYSVLAELIVRIFQYELNELLKKGICKDYISKEDSLSILKGRPNIRRQITYHQAMPIPLECDFDDYISDIPENQIIMDTLNVVCNIPLNEGLINWSRQMKNQPFCNSRYFVEKPDC